MIFDVSFDRLERWDGVLEEHLEVGLVPLAGLWGWLEGCEDGDN